MSIETYIKDPESFLDYSINWGDWLQTDEIIISSVWESSSDDVTLSLNAFSDTKATIWASGGNVDNDYLLTNTITTNQDRIDRRSITLTCEAK